MAPAKRKDDIQWQRVADWVSQEMADRGLTKAEVLDLAGLSFKTLKRVLEGKPLTRPDKKRGLAVAFRYQPDAVDRVLRGLRPKPEGPALQSDVNELGDNYGELFIAVAEQFHEMEDRIEVIERALKIESPKTRRFEIVPQGQTTSGSARAKPGPTSDRRIIGEAAERPRGRRK